MGTAILVKMLMDGFVSENFVFRSLFPKIDNFEEYLSWMNNQDNIYIESVHKGFSIQELTEFVHLKNSSDNAILIGVFCLKTGDHVGNVKFEPIEFTAGTAWMGIFIGNLNFRGRGFSTEIINASCSYLFREHQITEIYLGVHPKNIAALAAYKKCGFELLGAHEKGGLVMLLRFA
jgi:ribosomal-protein-alanine N-acetyltransferase